MRPASVGCDLMCGKHISHRARARNHFESLLISQALNDRFWPIAVLHERQQWVESGLRVPGCLNQGHRWHRRRGCVRARRSGGEERPGEAGQDGLRFRCVLVQGPIHPHGPGEPEACNRRLAQLIHHGRTTPSRIISHRLTLAEGPDAYKHFDARDDGWTKVVLKPAA